MRFEAGQYHLVAAKDARAERVEYLKNNPIPPNRRSTVGRVALERRPVHILDVLSDPEYTLSMQDDRGYRTILGIPLLRDGIAIGVIILTRGVVQPFDQRQIELVSTFADQALIAIENVRLFDEVQARTSELSQSVDELRALGEVSQAVNSTVDLATVLNTIVAKATQLSGTEAGAIYVFDDEVREFHLRATYGMDEFDDRRDPGSSYPHRRDSDRSSGRAANTDTDTGYPRRSHFARPRCHYPRWLSRFADCSAAGR